MDEFLATPHGLRNSGEAGASAPDSPGSSIAGSARDSGTPGTLSQISADLAAISASMMTQKDKGEIIREEIAAVRTNLTALEQRVDMLEVERLQTQQHRQASELATTRQGNILLDLRRQVEDLDNRGTTSGSEACLNLRMRYRRNY
ncbi:Hypothetical predicted protein [Pelobates cultripes]|uniref:Uncharacterized protein n=1 Tax=Pelobates cultripes TaxID=61616 RepID=A0AAD1R6N5_PELCU|nr:Hypothetical predicted protein [Pelobates cultripes]